MAGKPSRLPDSIGEGVFGNAVGKRFVVGRVVVMILFY